MHTFRFSSEEAAMNFIKQVNDMGVDWMPNTIYQSDGAWWLTFECDKRAWGIIMSLS